MILIGLAGRAGSGKDAFADALYDHHAFVKTSFAAPLRLAAQAIFGFSSEQLNDRNLKEAVSNYWGFSPRQALQKLGTEGVRDVFGDSTWMKRWALTYHTMKDTDHIVVTDVRFNNEAEMIRSLGGTIIHIVRPSNPFGIGTAHRSEQGVNHVIGDLVVENDGTLKELQDCAIGIVTDMLEGKF